MYATHTDLHNVKAIYWDQGDEVIHLHFVAGEGVIVGFNLFHTGTEPPKVEQVTEEGVFNPAGKLAWAAAERLKKELDTGATP